MTVTYYNREANGTPLQYSCLENPMNGGAWKAAVHEVAKSRAGQSDFIFTFTFKISTFDNNDITLQYPTLSSKDFTCVYVFIPYNNLEI